MVVQVKCVVASEKYRVGAIMISSRAQFVPHPLWRQPGPTTKLTHVSNTSRSSDTMHCKGLEWIAVAST